MPNETSHARALETLATLPFVEDSIREWTVDWFFLAGATETRFSCTYLEECGILVSSHDGVLKAIVLGFGYEITLGEVVTRLGPPLYVYFGPSSAGPGCKLLLSWPDALTQVESVDPSNFDPCVQLHDHERIESSLLATSLYYLSPEAFEDRSLSGLERIRWTGFTD